MSFSSSSFGSGAVLPVVIRTRAIIESSNRMPKNEKLPSPAEAGTKLPKISVPQIGIFVG